MGLRSGRVSRCDRGGGEKWPEMRPLGRRVPSNLLEVRLALVKWKAALQGRAALPFCTGSLPGKPRTSPDRQTPWGGCGSRLRVSSLSLHSVPQRHDLTESPPPGPLSTSHQPHGDHPSMVQARWFLDQKMTLIQK